MPKSSRPRMFGRGTGTVTMIDQPVQRSFLRRAKMAFWIIWVAVTLLAATILASMWEAHYGRTAAAIIALLAGALIGLAAAFLTACVVAAWPVLRAIWWWLPELIMTGTAGVGWTELVTHTGLAVRLATVITVIGVPAAITPLRRRISAVSWCLISRHRIRTCFNEFIIANRTGSLPLILGAVPTPAGERVWVFLRPGLSLADVQAGTERIAAACWASSVIADAAKAANSALVRIDIKRRDPLTGAIASPMSALAGTIAPRRKAGAPAPVAVDLTDVTADDVTATTGPASARPAGRPTRPQWPDQPAKRDASDDDPVADWI